MNNATSALLGVNIDHIATLRQQRDMPYPEPLQAAFIAEQGGADGITVHLREDRRHIQDRDVEHLNALIATRLNLEMAATNEMVTIAERVQPAHVCLVPEKREERTTEGGLDVITHAGTLERHIARLRAADIDVSLFIEPDEAVIKHAATVGANTIEIHTGTYADAKHPKKQAEELARICAAVEYGATLGLRVNAGHGLDYHNVAPIAAISDIYELNIGFAIVARAVFVGLESAVSQMKHLMVVARGG